MLARQSARLAQNLLADRANVADMVPSYSTITYNAPSLRNLYMPIYEYLCKKCDHTLDALQKIADAPLVDCPSCGESTLKRLLSAPRFRLKGQGWYETDFKKDNQRNLAGGDKEPSKPDSKSSDEKAKKVKSDDKAKAKPSSDKKTNKE